MTRIFEHLSARKYLQGWVQDNKGIRSGLQSRLAKIAGCRPSFISQVLTGKSFLSLEQGEKISSYLQLNEIEEEYFLTLILWERAATTALKNKLESRLQKIRDKSLNLSKRLTPLVKETENNEVLTAQYYSHWLYPAVHVSLGIAGLQNAYALSKALSVSESRVQEVLNFLEKAQLVEEKKGNYSATPFTLHLGTESPYLSLHHRNLHNLAIQLMDEAPKTDLQYSGFMSLSRNDVHKIKESLAAEIKKCIETAKLSDEEEVHLCQIGLLKIC